MVTNLTKPGCVIDDITFSLFARVPEAACVTERDGKYHSRKGRVKMTKLLRALGAAVLCLGLLSSASMAKQEQTTPAKDPQKKEHKMKTTTLNGTVSAVTDSAVTIVDGEKAEHTLNVTSETKVTKGGKDATLADVKANDVVAIEAMKGEGNSWTAMKISVS